MGTKGVLQMLHLPTDTFFRAKVLIIEIEFYVIKFLHIGLEDFCWNRTAVLGIFFFAVWLAAKLVKSSKTDLMQQNFHWAV